MRKLIPAVLALGALVATAVSLLPRQAEAQAVKKSGGCTANCTLTGTTTVGDLSTTTGNITATGTNTPVVVTVPIADSVTPSVAFTINSTGAYSSGNANVFLVTGSTPGNLFGVSSVGDGTLVGTLTAGAITLGGGTTLTKFSKGTTTSPAAQAASTCSDVAVTVTGAAVGDACQVAPPSGAMGNLAFTCYVTASNTAQLHKCNFTAGSLTPATGTYTLWTWH